MIYNLYYWSASLKKYIPYRLIDIDRFDVSNSFQPFPFLSSEVRFFRSRLEYQLRVPVIMCPCSF